MAHVTVGREIPPGTLRVLPFQLSRRPSRPKAKGNAPMSKHLYFDARRLGLGRIDSPGPGLGVSRRRGHRGGCSPACSAAPSVSTTVANNTLTITGTNGPDVVALRPDATDPSTLVVALGATGSVERHFDSRTFTSISVFLRGGNDQFTEQPGRVRGQGAHGRWRQRRRPDHRWQRKRRDRRLRWQRHPRRWRGRRPDRGRAWERHRRRRHRARHGVAGFREGPLQLGPG